MRNGTSWSHSSQNSKDTTYLRTPYTTRKKTRTSSGRNTSFEESFWWVISHNHFGNLIEESSRVSQNIETFVFAKNDEMAIWYSDKLFWKQKLRFARFIKQGIRDLENSIQNRKEVSCYRITHSKKASLVNLYQVICKLSYFRNLQSAQVNMMLRLLRENFKRIVDQKLRTISQFLRIFREYQQRTATDVTTAIHTSHVPSIRRTSDGCSTTVATSSNASTYGSTSSSDRVWSSWCVLAGHGSKSLIYLYALNNLYHSYSLPSFFLSLSRFSCRLCAFHTLSLPPFPSPQPKLCLLSHFSVRLTDDGPFALHGAFWNHLSATKLKPFVIFESVFGGKSPRQRLSPHNDATPTSLSHPISKLASDGLLLLLKTTNYSFHFSISCVNFLSSFLIFFWFIDWIAEKVRNFLFFYKNKYRCYKGLFVVLCAF